MKHVIPTLLFTVFTVFLSCSIGYCQIINTFAGNGTYSFFDGVAATATGLYSPCAVAFDGSGNVFIVAQNNFRIKKVNSAGIISTYAGSGTVGYSGDGGPATAANLNYPRDIAIDGSGNMYIADNSNNVVRKVNTAGIISTFAGTGAAGYAGDGGAATSAQLHNPFSVAIDGSGNIYIGDHFNHVVRKVNGSGIISTFAGNGTEGSAGDGGPATAAELGLPVGIAFDATGNLYIGDGYEGVVRKVNTAGVISTFAGNRTYGSSGDGGPATSAAVFPAGVAVDRWGNVYFSDNTFGRIRKVNTSGYISTYAGTGAYAYCCDGGPATAAKLASPYGVAVDTAGNVYIADASNGRVRAIARPPLMFTGGGLQGLTVCENTVNNSINSLLTVADTAVGLTETFSVTSPPSHGVVSVGSTVASGISILPTGWAYTPMTGYSGSDAFQVTVNNGYRSATTTIYVTVKPLPNAGVITGALTAHLCTGASMTLSDAAIGGTWTASNGRATVTVGGVVTAISSGKDTIYYTVTNSCGTAAASHIVTINPTPGPGAISGPSILCPGDTLTLINTGATTIGVWSSAYPTIATVNSAGKLMGISAGTNTIRYTVTDSSCVAVAIKVITVNPLPNAGTITGLTNVCVGSYITLTDTATGGVWSSAASTIASVNSTGVLFGISAGTDTIRYTLADSSCVAFAIKVITVNPLPNAGTITGLTKVCVGSNISLTDIAAGGIWSSNNIAVATIGSLTGIVTGIAAGTDTIRYTVTSAANCVSTVPFRITVNPVPAAGVITGSDSLCTGGQITLTDTVSQGTWSSNDTAVATIGSNTGIVSGIGGGNVLITYTVSSDSCASSTTYPVAILSMPDFTLAKNITGLKCYGDSDASISVAVTGTGQYQYQWSNGGDAAAITGLVAGTYLLKVKESTTQCAAQDTFNIVAADSISISILLERAYCNTNTGAINILADGGTPPYSYMWSNNGTTNEISSLPAGTYSLTVTDGNGCLKHLSATVTDSCTNIIINNGISPNGDGINDLWVIEGIENYPNSTIVVFDKWGDKVYEQKGYRNDWDGGKFPDGTYYYLVKLNADNLSGENSNFKGALMIKR